MKYEIDQSGRIEETNRYTIISLANKQYSYTVKIDSKIKRLIQKKFQKLGKPKMFGIYGFASGMIILIKKSKIRNSIITVDIEYDGYSDIIKEILTKYLDKTLEFRFTSIGKKSPAHTSAYSVYKKYIKSDYKVSKEELEKLMINMRPLKNK